jgi:putative membrane protein
MHARPILAIVAAAALAGSAGAAAAAAKPAPEFLKKAIQGDNSEIELGKIAQTRGASPGVRDFGRTLEQDHSQAKSQAVPVAQQLKVPVPDDVMPEAKKEADKLQHLSGPAFDHEFARYMVQDHKKDIHDFEEQARGKGPTAKLAQQTLPTLRKHLEMAERLDHQK